MLRLYIQADILEGVRKMKRFGSAFLLIAMALISALILTGFVLPMFAELVDWQSLNNISTAIGYIEQRGYSVLAEGERYNSDFLPSENNTYDIGSEKWRWDEGHFANLYVGGELVGTADNFTDLGDTPSSYSGQGNKYVTVKNDESGLEFTAGVGGVSVSGSPTANQTAIWTNATTITGANLSYGATICVAASDSSQAAKNAALASGGFVVSGDAEDELQAADDLADLVKGSVFGFAGTYPVTNADVTFTAPFVGEPTAATYSATDVGTVITLDSSSHIIIHYPGDLRNVGVVKTGGSDYIVKMEVIDGQTSYSYCAGRLLDNLRIREAGGGFGNVGLWLYVNAVSADLSIQGCNFGSLTVNYCDTGVLWEASETSPQQGWINGNNVAQATILGCDNKFWHFKANGTAAVGGNNIGQLQLQPSGNFNQLVYFENGDYNQLPSVITWDLDPTDTTLYFDSNSKGNYVRGQGHIWARVTDNGDYNDYYHMNQHNIYLTLTPEGGDGTLYPTETNGCGNATRIEYGTNNVWTLSFPNGSETHAQARIILPYGFDFSNADMQAQFGWTTTSGSVQNVTWGISAVALGDIANYATAQGTAVEVTDAMGGGAQGYRHVSSWTASFEANSTGIMGEELIIDVYRVDDDTLDRPALLTTVTLKIMASG